MTVTPDRQVLDEAHAFVAGDSRWQSKARLLQSQWRLRQGLEVGVDDHGKPCGSYLATADGYPPALRNYMTAGSRASVQAAVADERSTGALLARPRLWVNLLSSQPLCFNLFGDLASDLTLAPNSLRRLWPSIGRITAVRFEYSPGRGDLRYTGNRSAFDVFVEYESSDGRGFIGIEVKYHENMQGKRATDPSGRYPAMARASGTFYESKVEALSVPPLQQLWLDHLLALRMVEADHPRWARGTFVVLYPSENLACDRVVSRYEEALADRSTFESVTLERLIAALETGDGRAAALRDRYLGVSET